MFPRCYMLLCPYVYGLPFRTEGGMLDLIVLVPDHCFSFYFTYDTDVCQLLPQVTESIYGIDI